jgi:hypothetical protein
MASDEPLILDEDAQRVLAAWALKTAIMLDGAQGAPWRPTTMTAESRHLVEAGTPTNNVPVWLSGFLDPQPARARQWGTTANVVTIPGEHNRADIHGATITLDALCLQVIYAAVPNLPEAFAIEERPAIDLIWPYRAPFDWSQRNSFADADFEDLAAALPNPWGLCSAVWQTVPCWHHERRAHRASPWSQGCARAARVRGVW